MNKGILWERLFKTTHIAELLARRVAVMHDAAVPSIVCTGRIQGSPGNGLLPSEPDCRKPQPETVATRSHSQGTCMGADAVQLLL
jgi:hypothetical protein